ncbi:DNA gyrase subunit A [Ruminococcaceae bacterium R-25]|nr:DNA gyrase subunit A [Ruminococcaceae bacterium R-25]SUQ11479.1 DNA gyrase subunit A [Oscillospiraceae bacterium]
MARKKKEDINSDSLKARLTDSNAKDMPAIDQPITEMLEINYMPYAMSVIVSRAIPEIDGFKPSHRKLLYTMYKMGLLGGNRTKSANVVGQTMKLNPHGDQAIYDTMVRLTRGNGSLLHPFVDSKGNFGKQYSRDMQCAAPRYTEVRLEKICEEIFKGIDKDAVDMVDNYDGTLKEPTLLPTTFPAVLVNANQGIAVGMASNICSFNLAEVCAATEAYMRDPSTDLLEIMPAPDFSGGGKILYDKNQMKAIYDTGKGTFSVRARYQVDKAKNLIEITEIPYSTSVEAIIDNIADLVKSGKAKEIADIRDETDLDGLKITIDCKRGTDHEQLMTKLFRFTKLEDTFSCNFNILIDGSPRVMGIAQILDEWLKWRRTCVCRELSYNLDKMKKKLHLLDGLAVILLDIDKAIKIIRETELEADVIPNLMQGFGIDEEQAEYVAEIKLRNINKQYIINRISDRDKLKEDIADTEDMLNSPRRINNLIAKTLKEVAEKYGQPRKSELVGMEETETFVESAVIPDYRLHLMLTRHGYLKKHTMKSLQSAGELKTKDDDEIFMGFECENKSDLLIFTDKCNLYKTHVYDFSDTKPGDLGHYLNSELEMEDGERPMFMISTTDYKGILFIAFENGKAARFPISSYETKQNRKKLINAYFDGSKAVGFMLLDETEDPDLIVTNSLDKAAVFKASLIPLKTTRTTQGVQLLASKKGSVLKSLARLAEVNVQDPEYYRIRKVPAIGYYIKENSLEAKQVSFDDLK